LRVRRVIDKMYRKEHRGGLGGVPPPTLDTDTKRKKRGGWGGPPPTLKQQSRFSTVLRFFIIEMSSLVSFNRTHEFMWGHSHTLPLPLGCPCLCRRLAAPGCHCPLLRTLTDHHRYASALPLLYHCHRNHHWLTTTTTRRAQRCTCSLCETTCDAHESLS
jgi:hypothetical protein